MTSKILNPKDIAETLTMLGNVTNAGTIFYANLHFARRYFKKLFLLLVIYNSKIYIIYLMSSFSIKCYLNNQNINKIKLIKNYPIIYIIIFIPLILITYFLSYYLGIYTIIFFLCATFTYGYLSSKRISNNQDDFSYDFFFAPPLLNLLLIFLLNISNFDYFLYDFNISKNELLKNNGEVISSNINDVYDSSSKRSLIAIRSDSNLGIHVFNINVLNNRFYNNQINIPIGEKVSVLYRNIKYGRNNEILLVYDIRNKDKIYLNYKNRVKDHQTIQKKSLYFFILSMMLYTFITLFSIYFVINLSRSK